MKDNILSRLASVVKIVVHGGTSHADEILATAIALGARGTLVPVYRRDPTVSELEDPETLVMDVGGVHDPEKLDFDHHQLARTAPAACAFSLLAEWMGVAPQFESFFGWYATWRTIDSKGPFAWAKSAGVDWEAVSSLLSPVSDIVHAMFEQGSGDVPVPECLTKALMAKGAELLTAAGRFEAFCLEAEQHGCLGEASGVPLFDLRRFTAEDSLEFGGAWAKTKVGKGGVIASVDNRGPGWALFRRDDDRRIDFARCAGKPYTAFAHAGGFILKTVAREGDIGGMIADARTEADEA